MIAQKIHDLDYDIFKKYIVKYSVILNYYKKKINIYFKRKNFVGSYINQIIDKKLNITYDKNFKYSYYCYELIE